MSNLGSDINESITESIELAALLALVRRLVSFDCSNVSKGSVSREIGCSALAAGVSTC